MWIGTTSALDIFTDRVRSTREGYVLTRVCPCIHPPSVCLSTPGGGGVLHPGPDGGGGVPWPGPGRGVPMPRGHSTSGTPGQTWPGGTPARVVPPPPSDLAGGTLLGGTPTGGTPARGYPTSYTPPSDLAEGGSWYPTSVNRWSTWYTLVIEKGNSMILAFTQDFLMVYSVSGTPELGQKKSWVVWYNEERFTSHRDCPIVLVPDTSWFRS